MRRVGSISMIMIVDDTLVSTNSVAVDICADNVIDVEVDLELGH